MTEIKYATIKRDGLEDEKVYFTDEALREKINTKQQKLIAGRGLKLKGNTLSLSDNISGSSNIKYFTVSGLRSCYSYEGCEIYEGSSYAKLDVEFAYFGNPQLFIEYVNTYSGSDTNYSYLNFVDDVESGFEPNKEKATSAISALAETEDDYFCLLPLRVTSGSYTREVIGYRTGSIEACMFAGWYYDYYGTKQTNSDNKIIARNDLDNIIPIIWKQFAS